MAGTVTCKSCGKAVAAGDRFCASCGTVVTLADETVLAPSGQQAGTSLTQCLSCGAAMGRDDRFCKQCGGARPEAATVVSHVSLRNTQALRLVEATQGEFEILEQLGTGAMGAVYLAKDVALGRKVAIKVIAPHLLSDETMISRFRMEAQTVASLRHPNIVNVHAVRQSAELHYFVMEFIDGPPLRSLVKSHAPLDVDVVQTIMFQVGSALSYAHRSRGGVIHRDVKPANIMVDREGDAFVTDFGISKIAESQSGLTQTGATIGTPEYMSPEQCRGDALTGASDQYALGVVAYEMLCGHTPFSGSQYYIMVAHTTEPAKPIRELRPDCPAPVAAAVERMLAKAPEERWPDLDSAVLAMGGAPLGYHDPIRQKIKALTGATLRHVPAVGAGSRSGGASGGRATLDTATSVSVLGVPSVLETGERIQLRADVRGSGNTSLGGEGVVWASTDPSIAKVEGGWVEGLKPGSVSIMASAGNVASSVLLNVAEPAPVKVMVRPVSVRMQRGGKIGLSAQVQDKRGRPLERPVRWVSSEPRVATVSPTGEVVAKGSGSVRITAQSESATGTAEVLVEAPATAASPVAPAAVPKPRPAARPPEPAAAQAGAGAAPDSSRPVYRHPAALAAVLAVLLGVGVVSVLWRGDGGAGTGDAGPTPPGPPNVGSPTSPPGRGAAAADVPVPSGATPPGASASGDPGASGPPPDRTAVAAPPEAPPGSGRGPGAVGAASAPAPVTAERLDVTVEATMPIGGFQAANARVFAAGDAPMGRGSYALSWRSSNGAVLRVNPQTGGVQAVAPGSAWVVAAAGNARDSALVTVAAATAAVAIAEQDFTLTAGAPPRALNAAVVGPDGRPVDRDVTWTSSDPTVASVDAAGRVTAGAPGTALITASADGFSDEIMVSVTEPPAPARAAAVPSAEQVRAALAEYVAALGRRDRDYVTRLWGGGDQGARDDVVGLLGQNRFTATLGEVGTPTQEGSGASVTFQVATRWRTNFGQNRDRQLALRALLERVGSEWQVVRVAR